VSETAAAKAAKKKADADAAAAAAAAEAETKAPVEGAQPEAPSETDAEAPADAPVEDDAKDGDAPEGTDEAAQADDAEPTAPPAPSAAPLEPPAAAPVVTKATPIPSLADASVDLAANTTSQIVVSSTDEVPDLDALFVPADEAGTRLRCTMRLVRTGYVGPHDHPIRQLVIAAGTEVDARQAAALKAEIAARA
jgi:hypothetical protein